MPVPAPACMRVTPVIRYDLITQASPGDTTFNALAEYVVDCRTIAGRRVERAVEGAGASQSHQRRDRWKRHLCNRHRLQPAGWRGVARTDPCAWACALRVGARHIRPVSFYLPGVQLFTGGSTAVASYFSVDAGNTDIADFGLHSDPSDFLNPGPTFLGGPYSNLTPGDPLQRTLRFRHPAKSNGRRQEADRRVGLSPDQHQHHCRHRDIGPGGTGWRRRGVAQQFTRYHRWVEHDAVGRDDQGYRSRRRRLSGRQTLRQWRAERHGRWWPHHRQLERLDENPYACRRRLDRRL